MNKVAIYLGGLVLLLLLSSTLFYNIYKEVSVSTSVSEIEHKRKLDSIDFHHKIKMDSLDNKHKQVVKGFEKRLEIEREIVSFLNSIESIPVACTLYLDKLKSDSLNIEEVLEAKHDLLTCMQINK